jgi:hypothetical protein
MFCSYLLYFPHFGILHQEKSGNPAQFMNIGNPLTQLSQDHSALSGVFQN